MGCSQTPDHTDRGAASSLKEGWTRVDVPLPTAALRMNRIGQVGPERLPPDGTVVINFWASTCGPCRKEIPLFERLSRAGVRVVGVSRDNILRYAKAEIRDRHLTFPNYSDASGDVMFGLKRVLFPNGIPTTVIVRGGRVRWVHIGAFASYPELTKSIVDKADTMTS